MTAAAPDPHDDQEERDRILVDAYEQRLRSLEARWAQEDDTALGSLGPESHRMARRERALRRREQDGER